ncbi:unnamed protein product [Blepharisma stoltei]|uniref:Peptidyl-tRNA hydrolase n=1 Tax=Blepharisma stoltei TaxID=1481888 RepID=A0AAU9KBK7_9CILI|nr:unnamed protein product [Blepharisma stoltei]
MSYKYKLLIGLGNPPAYKLTKHNVGQQFLDSLGTRFEYDKKLEGYISNYNGILLFKPHSYMNICGGIIKKAIKSFNTQFEELIILHDDLDTPIGKAKIKNGGSANGHNGVISVISALQTNKFDRLKIGIGRPGDISEVSDYVLTQFKVEEKAQLKEAFKKSKELLGIK